MSGLVDWVSKRDLSGRIIAGLRQNLFPGIFLWLIGMGLVSTLSLIHI